MRLPVSLLVLCAAITGCTSSRSSSSAELTDTITITSNPTGAAVRLNGRAVGRTPAKVEVERTSNYLLEVGKSGYKSETASLKPRILTTRRGTEYGFPETINVTLAKEEYGSGVTLSKSDEAEFKKLSRKANGTEETTGVDSLESDIAAVKDAAEKMRADLAVRENNSQIKLAAIAKAIADIKAGKQDSLSAAKLNEAQLALKEATEEAERTRVQGVATLQSLEARRIALENQSDKAGAKKVEQQIATTQDELNKNLQASNTKIAAAQASLSSAKLAGESSKDSIARLEAAAAAESASVSASQARTNEILRALAARAEELARIQAASIQAVKAESNKEVQSAQKALDEQKAALAKAINERNAAVAAEKAASSKATEAARAEAEAKLKIAEAKAAAAEDTVAKITADAKAEAEAKVKAANEAAAEAKAKAEREILELRAQTDKALAEAREQSAKLVTETQTAAEAKLAEAQKAAEQAIAKARAEAEAIVAEAKAAAAAAAARAKELAYSEFSARYALLENRFRNKAITESEYKQQLASLRKELGL